VLSIINYLALRASLRDEDGATAVEYGIMVGLIAAVIVAVVIILGDQINAAFQTVVDALTGAGIGGGEGSD
jgi:pilus assembly protein Flp/PilA